MRVVALALLGGASACSNLLVSPGASTDESALITYNADSADLYGSLYHYPAQSNMPEGTMRDVWDWDSGVYLGQIPEANETFNVIGNVNEWGVTIGETTAGGLEILQSQSDAILDYGSLIYLGLQRSKTAREAIAVIGDLMAKYGYASEGESFSIGDPNEVFIMEIVGKGDFELGAVWVARKVPDGYVCGHANQMRITTFPLDDEDTLYADDVISFARTIGAFNGTDDEFSFSDVYDPVTFEGARFCEGRVYSFFANVTNSSFAEQYADYAMGLNLENRMPLWVKPSEPVSVLDAMSHMRNHFEESVLAFTEDVGAGPFGLPYRWRPLTWEHDGATYLNERAIGTQQTGWNFVSQMRRAVPRQLGALLWFGVDDSATTVRFPVWGSVTAPATAFAGAGTQQGVTPPMMEFSMKNAHSVFNLVANFVYGRWDQIYPEVLTKIEALQEGMLSKVQAIEAAALVAMESDPDAAVAMLTAESNSIGNWLVAEWGDYFGQLFVKYRDGYTIATDPTNTACGCQTSNPGYGDAWYERIVDETGDQYVDLDYAQHAQRFHQLPTKSKRTLKALQ